MTLEELMAETKKRAKGHGQPESIAISKRLARALLEKMSTLSGTPSSKDIDRTVSEGGYAFVHSVKVVW